MPIVLFHKSQYLPHIVVFLTTHCEALDAIVVVVLDYFVGLYRVTEIVFVENDELVLLVAFDYFIEFGIATTVRYSGIADLHEDVDLVGVLLHDS